MPSLTEFDRSLRTGFFRKANGLLKGKTKKVASEVPMLSQVGNVMKSSGIEHRAEIVKRILMKGKPVNLAAKTSSAPPTSSHHGVPARKIGKVEVPQMDAASKISADMDLIKASLLMPRVGGLLSGAKMPMSAAKGIVRGAEKRVTPSAMWSGAQGSGARSQLKQEGVTPRSAGHTQGRGYGIQPKPAIFSGGAAGASRPLPSLAKKPAPMQDPWSHARVAVSEAREMLKASVSQSFIASRQTGRLAKAMEAAGHSTTQVRARGAAEAAILPKDPVKPKSLTHGLLRSHIQQFSKTVPKPAMMPA